MIAEWIQEISQHFTPERYMFWTRIQGTTWTCADFLIVYFLIRIGNLCRCLTLRSPEHWPYVVLALTIPLAAMLPFTRDSDSFFYISLCTTIPHFLLIIYLLWRTQKVAPEALHRLLRDRAPSPSSRST
jgi:hypothetical protein